MTPRVESDLHRKSAVRRLGSLGIVVSLMTGVVACDGETNSPKAMFSSDEAAYDAAAATYAAYAKAVIEVGNAGGAGADRFFELADTTHANSIIRDANEWRRRGLHVEGSGTFHIDGLEAINDERSELQLRICEAVGDSRTVDEEGTDVTPADRPAQSPKLFLFVTTPLGRMVISGNDYWDGDDFC